MFATDTRGSISATIHWAVMAAILWLVTNSPLGATASPIDFSGFTGSGFVPDPALGQLDSDQWRVTGLSDGDGVFGGVHDMGDFAQGESAGNVSTGGVYAFDVGDGNMALGVQPGSSDFTPGTFTLKVVNNTGYAVANVSVAYEVWVLNNEGRSSSLSFSYSLEDETYWPVPDLDLTTPEGADPTAEWSNSARSTTLSGLDLPADASIYLRWTGDDASGSGSRDEIAIDDVDVLLSDPNAIALKTFRARSVGSVQPLLALLGFVVLGVASRRKRWVSLLPLPGRACRVKSRASR